MGQTVEVFLKRKVLSMNPDFLEKKIKGDFSKAGQRAVFVKKAILPCRPVIGDIIADCDRKNFIVNEIILRPAGHTRPLIIEAIELMDIKVELDKIFKFHYSEGWKGEFIPEIWKEYLDEIGMRASIVDLREIMEEHENNK